LYQLSYKGKAIGEAMDEERAMAKAAYLKPCFLNLEVIRTAEAEAGEQSNRQASA